MEDAIETSSATFVGTVTAVENYRRWATVEVTDTWKGEVTQTDVLVKGGPRDPDGRDHIVTTVDRSYRVGKTYLFVVHEGTGSVFKDNICSRTTPYRSGLDRFRPLSATPIPTPESTPTPESAGDAEQDRDDEAPVGTVLPVGLAALLVVGGVLWVLRTKRA
jgi:hypothetical protein